jgi:hypothetical protein
MLDLCCVSAATLAAAVAVVDPSIAAEPLST